MSDPTAQEPTMEEILASIRRIISEDDAPAAEIPGEVALAPEPAPPPRVEPAAVHAAPAVHQDPEDADDEVLELTDPAPPPAPVETHGDIDVFVAPPKPEPVKPEPVVAETPAYEPPPEAPSSVSFVEDEPLLSGGSQEKAASQFGRLTQSIAMPPSSQTLDGVVRELLRPLLKAWLDEHLPAIVEERVQAEVDRVFRRRV